MSAEIEATTHNLYAISESYMHYWREKVAMITAPDYIVSSLHQQ